MGLSYTKILIKLNLDTVEEAYDITFEGCEPKLCTAYKPDPDNIFNYVLIPIRELIKQGVSLHNEDLEWYEKGDAFVDGKPCKVFRMFEVTVLCS